MTPEQTVKFRSMQYALLQHADQPEEFMNIIEAIEKWVDDQILIGILAANPMPGLNVTTDYKKRRDS